MLLVRTRPRVSEWIEAASTLGLIALLVASWVTHVLVCLAGGLWGLLVAGILIFPVAVLHGLFVLTTTWLQGWL